MLNLIIIGLITIFVSFFLYLLNRKTKFSQIKPWLKQTIIGIIFGVLAILSTKLSLSKDEFTINVRDSVPLCAALIFGWPAGIITGTIGGVERYIAGTFFGVGPYTKVACSLACIIAGGVSAIIKKVYFKNKIPNCFWGFLMGIGIEVMHMLLLIFTNFNEAANIFIIVKTCANPMILGVGLVAMFSLLTVNLYELRENNYKIDTRKSLPKMFQKGLVVLLSLSFIATLVFAYSIQHKISNEEAESLLILNLEDLKETIEEDLPEEDLKEKIKNWRVGKNGGIAIYDMNGKILFATYNGELLNATENLSDYAHIKPLVVFNATINKTKSYCIYQILSDYNYIIVSYIPVNEVTLYQDLTMYITVFTEIIIFVLLFGLIYYMINRLVVQNIQKVVSGLKRISNGNLETKIEVRTTKEFNYLSNDINKTVDTLKYYIDEANSRIDKELALAKEIQHSALPNVFLPFPDHKEFDIYASMNTAKEVGGDFYDFYLLDTTHLALVIADVSDKGIPAALFMMRAKAIIKSLMESGKTITTVLKEANDKLCENNDKGMFVTAWLGVIDLTSGKLTYASAGHTHPLISNNGTFNYLNEKHSFILGGLPNMKYTEYELTMEKNSILYLYTDGVTEAVNSDNKLFGEEKLQQLINSIKPTSMQELCEEILQNIENFASGACQADDITMLAFKYNGISKLNELEIASKIPNIDEVTTFVCNKIPEEKLPKIKASICIALDEIISNICKFAYKDNEEGKIKITVDVKNDGVSISFTDTGVPFNPLLMKEVDTTLSLEARPIGGLGIYLVKKMMDNVKYEYCNDANIFTIFKKYEN